MSRVHEILDGLWYSFYVIFHPFKGFWDLKKEKKGNLRSAVALVMALILVFICRRQFTGYLFNNTVASEMNVLSEISSVVLVFLLWCVSNWCITTLVDGEGSLQDIIITTAYALTPLILINIPLILLSNVMVLDEAAFYTLFDTISMVWFGFLLLIGILTVHQFSMGKTIVTIGIALLGMVVIVFIVILLFALIQQFINFGILFFRELGVRQNW